MEQQRKIQIVRAMAVFLVIMTHTVFMDPHEMIVRPFINGGVPVFLFLSGYLTLMPIGDVGSFYKKRLLRILIPYLLWSVIYTVYHGTYCGFPWNLLTGQCCSIFYYILVYLQCVLLTPLLGRLIRSQYRWIGYLITPLAILGEQLLAWKGILLIYPWNVNNCLVWMIFFYVGLDMRNRGGKQESAGRIIGSGIGLIVGLLLEIFVVAPYWKDLGRYDIATSQVKLITMINSLLLLRILAEYLRKAEDVHIGKVGVIQVGREIMVAIGDASFGIYLCHSLLIDWFMQFGFYRSRSFVGKTFFIYAASFLLIRVAQGILGKKVGRYFGVY